MEEARPDPPRVVLATSPRWLTRTLPPLAGVGVAALLFLTVAVASAMGPLGPGPRLVLLASGAFAWTGGLAWAAWVGAGPSARRPVTAREGND